jgi:hypothetical protein
LISLWFGLTGALFLLFWDGLGYSHDCGDGGVVTFDACDGVTICESLELFSLCKDVVYLDHALSQLKDHVSWHRF